MRAPATARHKHERRRSASLMSVGEWTCDNLVVVSRRDAGEVRRLLTAALRARLQPAGWEILETRDDHFRLAAFRHGLDEQWAATCTLGRASSTPDCPPVLVTNVMVGVSYEPLRRLSPLLDFYEVDVFRERVWPETDGDADRRVADALKIATDLDIEHAVQSLAPVIMERAIPFAEQHADLEGLLARFSQGETDRARLTCAALQATAGRFDEARQALTHLTGSEPSGFGRRIRRAARQLDRWIDSAGSPSLIPTAPPPQPFGSEPMPSFSELRRQNRAQRAALDDVQAAAEGEPRERARQMLRDALSRHGADQPRPLWIEYQLDHLWDSRDDQLGCGVQLFKTVADLGVKAARAVRDREIPDLAPPGWLEPPSHALYAIPRSGHWTAAELDPDARPYLDRVYEAVPHPFGLAALAVWIRHAEGTPGSRGVIDVVLGETRVGTIFTTDAAVYVPVLADAAAREEHPCLEAYLAQRHGEYLLEIATPPAPP
jgi:hypothetical protein